MPMQALGWIDSLDQRASGVIYRWELGALEYLLIVPTMLFGTHGLGFVGVWTFLQFGLATFCLLFISSLLTVIITELSKDALKRPRPVHGITGHRYLHIRHLLTNFSLPSGDSAQAINFLGLAVAMHTPRPLLVMPLLALLGRVYFGVHFIGDVLVGSAIGWCCSRAVFGSPVIVRAATQWPLVVLPVVVALALFYHAVHKRIALHPESS